MPVTTMPTFGDLIRQHRIAKGLTLNKLSDLTGINKGTISKIENGEVKKPEFRTLKIIAEALQIPYETYLSLYIGAEKSPDVISSILNNAIKEKRSIPIITQIAIKFLETERLDSYDATAQLFNSTQSQEDSELKLALYKTIINYSRGHGVMPYLARSLFQEYLIERNNYSKLKDTYQSGKYILKYKDLLPPGEYATLLYCLMVHSYVIREHEDCINYCRALLVNKEEEAVKVRTYAIDNLRGSHYHLGNFELAEKYAEEYRKCVPSVENVNDRLITAMINAKRGNVELATEQFEKCLQLCNDGFIVHIVTEYISLCLDRNHLDKIRDLLLTYERKICDQAYTTPMERNDLAKFYKLKGDYYTQVNDIIQAIRNYIKGAYAYASINNKDSNRSCLQLVFQLGCFSWVYSHQSK